MPHMSSTTLKTRTGGFGIGFRKGWTDWFKDPASLIAFAKQHHFACIDVGRDDLDLAKQVVAAGLGVGSADLAEWRAITSADAAKRKDAVAKNLAAIEALCGAGARQFFLVAFIDDPKLPRSQSHAHLVESCREMAPTLEKHGAHLVFEGYPAHDALVCTPEGYRALFRDVPSVSMAVNYDPSHLIRLRIDPIRFLHEFASRVRHVHGKDAEVIEEAVYELGVGYEPTFAKPRGFGSATWRYTIPGHGQMRWGEAMRLLVQAGYRGHVSIELEDEHFNGSTPGEQLGLHLSGQYLAGV